LDLSTFLEVLSEKNKKIRFYFSDKRSIQTFDPSLRFFTFGRLRGLRRPL
jgi:hypothetical protein